MNSKRRLTIRSNIFSVILIAIVFTSSCGERTKKYDIDPKEFQVVPINTYYDDAYKIASEWDTNPYCDYILSTFAMPNDNDGSLRIIYGFRSRSNPAKWLTVTFDALDPAQYKVADGLFSEGNKRPFTQEIEVGKLPFDITDTLIIAYQNGGNDFLQENKGFNSDSFVELQQENEFLGTGPLVWIVTFSSNRYKTMYVKIDALTGDVLDVWRNDR